MVERVGDKGSLNTRALEWGMDVVWRLKRGKRGECVMVLRGMGSEVVDSDGKVWFRKGWYKWCWFR